jgi:drug/metabolite transporter (DMT)-like permease
MTTTDGGHRPAEAHMTREAWVLFAALSVIWGVPYLFIKVAVTELSPAAVAGGRTLLAALVLIPLAARQGALRPALRLWPWAVAFGVIEMAIPWLLLGEAEIRVSSGFAGLMLATVPLVGALLAWLRREPQALARIRLLGVGTGILGVVALVGLDSLAGTVDARSVIELVGVAIGYAVAPVIAAKRLGDVPSMGVIAVAVGVVALIYLPATVTGFSAGLPSPSVLWSVIALALVCTALAFTLFFRLIATVGPVRATVITFVNPAVAIVLGILVLGEPLTWGIVVGFPLVLLGSYWATRVPAKPRTSPPDQGAMMAA